jgi:hypothetical protein
MRTDSLKGHMKQTTLLSALIALLFAVSIPVVSASTVNITLNPATGVAEVTGISTTKVVFTYPVNSSVSNFLKEYNYSNQESANIAGGQSSTDDFQNALRNYTPGISVENMSVSVNSKAIANSTTLVITKETNITAWVTGVFNETNGKVMADLEWKAFVIRGSFDVPLNGHDFDLNTLGSAVVEPLGGDGFASSFLVNSFGGDAIWSRSTIDFSALDSPLSNWTRVYDSSTNTTTFTKNINTNYNFSSSYSFNGQTYSLSMTYDPSSTVRVLGFASPSGNSLIIESPPGPSPTTIGALVLITSVILAASAFMAIRWRAKSRSLAPLSPS